MAGSGIAVRVVWAGWAPGFVGLSQIIVQAPESFGTSSTASAMVLLDGEPGESFVFPVQGSSLP